MASNAGWYPSGDGRLRYWDGERWTNHFAPVAGASNPAGGWAPPDGGHHRTFDAGRIVSIPRSSRQRQSSPTSAVEPADVAYERIFAEQVGRTVTEVDGQAARENWFRFVERRRVSSGSPPQQIAMPPAPSAKRAGRIGGWQVFFGLVGIALTWNGVVELIQRDDKQTPATKLVIGLAIVGFLVLNWHSERRSLADKATIANESWAAECQRISAANSANEAAYRGAREQLEAEARQWNDQGLPVLELRRLLRIRSELMDKIRERVRIDLSISDSEWSTIVDDPTRMLTVCTIQDRGELEAIDLDPFVGSEIWRDDTFPTAVHRYLAPVYFLTHAIIDQGGVSKHTCSFDLVAGTIGHGGYQRLRWDAVSLISRGVGEYGFHQAVLESTGGTAIELDLNDGSHLLREERTPSQPPANALAFMDLLQQQSSQR